MLQTELPTVRPAAVAGAFYPAEAAQLARTIDAYLAEAPPRRLRAKAVVVPHAGYVYSGPIAASAYAVVRELVPRPTKVVLLGPAHTVAFLGVALPDADALETPLGAVPVDAALAQRALELPFVVSDARMHAREHSLEVQLPFLQRVLGKFTVLPLCVGQASAAEVSQLLEAVWGGPETLVVVSTDLSHYLPHGEAKATDARTAARILALDTALDGDEACGARPLNGLLLSARRHGLTAVQLDLRTSGDTAGDRARVVGYGAFAFVPGGAP